MLDLLKKVPFLSAAVSFVTGRVRLVIEYTLIALVIASTATAITLWYRANYLEKSNDELRERITNVELINVAQDKAISDLQELRQQDAVAMAGLLADYAKVSKSDTAVRKKLTDMEKQNASVHGYLDESLPPELGCLLNNSCPAARTGNTGDKNSAPAPPVGTVQGARTTGNSEQSRLGR
jgi:hypothetical protein